MRPRPVAVGTGRSSFEPIVAPLVLVLVLFGAAVLVAPEHPQDQAAICQRHNGVDACRVW
ncbi:MAG: hypothetical protein RLZZ336_882 [Cyanobacteriota bacterium]